MPALHRPLAACLRSRLRAGAALYLLPLLTLLAAGTAAAQPQPAARPAAAATPPAAEQAVQPLPPGSLKNDKDRTRTTSLPARGLFIGDQLSPQARDKLNELVIEAAVLDVQVALLVPTGPWQIDGSGSGERELTPARLEAVRRFLAARGVDPKRIFVESRVEEKLAEPRLDVQLVGQPAND